MPIPSELPQKQKCIFCPTDPQGTHRRFDNIERVNRIKCNAIDHDIFTCGRCTSNYHSVAETTPELEAQLLPRIILTSPGSEHSSVLEEFRPDTKALYPPFKGRGRANWLGYKWMPRVPDLMHERATQMTKARNRMLKKQTRKYGGVKLLATSVLASTPVAFFKPTGKAAADGPKEMSQVAGSPTPNLPNGEAEIPPVREQPGARSFADVVRNGGQKLLCHKNAELQKTAFTPPASPISPVPIATTAPVGPKNPRMNKAPVAAAVVPQKPPEIHRTNTPNTTSSPSVNFSWPATHRNRKPRIIFGVFGLRSYHRHPSENLTPIHIANGSLDHRPTLSPSIYKISFTTHSDLEEGDDGDDADDEGEGEDTLPPTFRPPSPTWSIASSTSTDSSCLSGTDWA